MSVRHFLGLKGQTEAAIREILTLAARYKAERNVIAWRAAGAPDLGDDFHEILDAHAHLVRGRGA